MAVIRTDFQSNECLDPETVMVYAMRMRCREPIEPVGVCHDGENYWLKDGFHRLAAAKELGRKTIAAELVPGTYSEMEDEWRRMMAAAITELRRGI